MAGRGRGSGTVRGLSDSAVDIAGGAARASGGGVRLVQDAGVEPGFASAGFVPCTEGTATGLAPGAAPEATRGACLGAPTKTSTGSPSGSCGSEANENFGVAG